MLTSGDSNTSFVVKFGLIEISVLTSKSSSPQQASSILRFEASIPMAEIFQHSCPFYLGNHVMIPSTGKASMFHEWFMHRWRLAHKFSSFTTWRKVDNQSFSQVQIIELCITDWVYSTHRTILAAEKAQWSLLPFIFEFWWEIPFFS